MEQHLMLKLQFRKANDVLAELAKLLFLFLYTFNLTLTGRKKETHLFRV